MFLRGRFLDKFWIVSFRGEVGCEFSWMVVSLVFSLFRMDCVVV